MKICELCKSPARCYCESDEASLCWTCDAKVHGANFLVARHRRTLLCRCCQSLTPWQASGSKLGRVVSVCDRCSNIDVNRTELERQESHESANIDQTASDAAENGDNQVVPRPFTTPPPPAPSSSSSSSASPSSSNHKYCVNNGVKSLKRARDVHSLHQDNGEEEGISTIDLSLKEQRVKTDAVSRSVRTMECVNRFQGRSKGNLKDKKGIR